MSCPPPSGRAGTPATDCCQDGTAGQSLRLGGPERPRAAEAALSCRLPDPVRGICARVPTSRGPRPRTVLRLPRQARDHQLATAEPRFAAVVARGSSVPSGPRGLAQAEKDPSARKWMQVRSAAHSQPPDGLTIADAAMATPSPEAQFARRFLARYNAVGLDPRHPSNPAIDLKRMSAAQAVRPLWTARSSCGRRCRGWQAGG
jgi:hypothetical protein